MERLRRQQRSYTYKLSASTQQKYLKKINEVLAESKESEITKALLYSYYISIYKKQLFPVQTSGDLRLINCAEQLILLLEKHEPIDAALKQYLPEFTTWYYQKEFAELDVTYNMYLKTPTVEQLKLLLQKKGGLELIFQNYEKFLQHSNLIWKHSQQVWSSELRNIIVRETCLRAVHCLQSANDRRNVYYQRNDPTAIQILCSTLNVPYEDELKTLWKINQKIDSLIAAI